MGRLHGGFGERDRCSRVAGDDGEDIARADATGARDQGGWPVVPQQMREDSRYATPVGEPVRR